MIYFKKKKVEKGIGLHTLTHTGFNPPYPRPSLK